MARAALLALQGGLAVRKGGAGDADASAEPVVLREPGDGPTPGLSALLERKLGPLEELTADELAARVSASCGDGGPPPEQLLDAAFAALEAFASERPRTWEEERSCGSPVYALPAARFPRHAPRASPSRALSSSQARARVVSALAAGDAPFMRRFGSAVAVAFFGAADDEARHASLQSLAQDLSRLQANALSRLLRFPPDLRDDRWLPALRARAAAAASLRLLSTALDALVLSPDASPATASLFLDLYGAADVSQRCAARRALASAPGGPPPPLRRAVLGADASPDALLTRLLNAMVPESAASPPFLSALDRAALLDGELTVRRLFGEAVEHEANLPGAHAALCHLAEPPRAPARSDPSLSVLADCFRGAVLGGGAASGGPGAPDRLARLAALCLAVRPAPPRPAPPRPAAADRRPAAGGRLALRALGGGPGRRGPAAGGGGGARARPAPPPLPRRLRARPRPSAGPRSLPGRRPLALPLRAGAGARVAAEGGAAARARRGLYVPRRPPRLRPRALAARPRLPLLAGPPRPPRGPAPPRPPALLRACVLPALRRLADAPDASEEHPGWEAAVHGALLAAKLLEAALGAAPGPEPWAAPPCGCPHWLLEAGGPAAAAALAALLTRRLDLELPPPILELAAALLPRLAGPCAALGARWSPAEAEPLDWPTRLRAAPLLPSDPVPSVPPALQPLAASLYSPGAPAGALELGDRAETVLPTLLDLLELATVDARAAAAAGAALRPELARLRAGSNPRLGDACLSLALALSLPGCSPSEFARLAGPFLEAAGPAPTEPPAAPALAPLALLVEATSTALARPTRLEAARALLDGADEAPEPSGAWEAATAALEPAECELGDAQAAALLRCAVAAFQARFFPPRTRLSFLAAHAPAAAGAGQGGDPLLPAALALACELAGACPAALADAAAAVCVQLLDRILAASAPPRPPSLSGPASARGGRRGGRRGGARGRGRGARRRAGAWARRGLGLGPPGGGGGGCRRVGPARRGGSGGGGGGGWAGKRGRGGTGAPSAAAAAASAAAEALSAAVGRAPGPLRALLGSMVARAAEQAADPQS
eukprot:tig00021073_g18051.t1